MGVLRLDTKTFDTGEAPLKLAIADITVNSLSQGTKEYPAGKEVTLPADANRVTIRFAALTYGGKAPELEYQLQGVDEAPIVVHGKNVYEATYTNLPGGSYKFRVQAKNSPTTNAKATASCSLKERFIRPVGAALDQGAAPDAVCRRGSLPGQQVPAQDGRKAAPGRRAKGRG
jgi:hypothetical protein